ncbi:DUF3572 family protein [Aureimonas leprariae]|uniref:DUF3572 family protein n=1 Tax=Plantimonas leprariae TaxID=2615207 RepID=A0A7V7PMB1_9HYPH|nr:DUF3572 family protein [Aureimonas leprariae]KAB0678045.1 DUF3572 family protein [Aureimonas leprariae]
MAASATSSPSKTEPRPTPSSTRACIRRRSGSATASEQRLPSRQAEATKPAFFVGLLDFLLANEADLIDFAGAAGLDPAKIGRARDALAQG